MHESPLRADGLVDIAGSGLASQSTLSRWSRREGARAAVMGDLPRDFAIHTDGEEDRPWWQLDLGSWYPVERIVVRNRRTRAFWPRARTIRIEASEDAQKWVLLHSGLSYFGVEDADALTIPLAGHLPLRFVRLSLEEREPLHLSRVEVLVSADALRDRRLMESIGLAFSQLSRYSHGAVVKETYRVVNPPPAGDARVHGLRVTPTGRFASNVYQMAQALQVAEARGLEFVQMLDTELFDFSQNKLEDSPRIIAASAEPPPAATMVEGDFYYMDRLAGVLGRRTRTSRDLARTARTRLAPYLALPEAPLPPASDELLVHVRSGDVFGDHPHPGYGQPPLSFYTWAIDHARQRGFVAVRVIAEDSLNPVVPALENHLVDHGIPHTMQIGEDLSTDLATFLAGRGVVFGVGTFGHAVCMLSSAVEVVYEASENKGYRTMFPHADVYSARPGSDYTTFSHWTKSPAQLDEMLAYPAADLTLRERPGTPPR